MLMLPACVPAPRVPAPPIFSSPAVIVVAPVPVLAPLRVRTPHADFSRRPGPVMTTAQVRAAVID